MGIFGDLAGARNRVLDRQGQQQQQDAAHQDAIRQKMLEMALQIRGQNQSQTNADRSFGLQQKTADYTMSQPKAPVLGSPEYGDAEARLEEARERIRAKYRPAVQRNIDPLSPQGIAATRQINASKPEPGSQPAEGERKAAAMMHRVIPAGQSVNKFDSRGSLDEIASKVGFMGNWGATPQGRQLRSAGKAWALAVLRPESGATISDKEMDDAFVTWLPQPGDDDKTLSDKRQRRREAEEGVGIQAGRALPKGSFTSAIQADSAAAAPHHSSQLLPADQARAATDPAFAAFLKTKGH